MEGTSLDFAVSIILFSFADAGSAPQRIEMRRAEPAFRNLRRPVFSGANELSHCAMAYRIT
jgi:hypothetical protein